jgi:SNF2 family DNA or RNA helicase
MGHQIQIDIANSNLVLSGATTELLKISRLLISLRRLKYQLIGDQIYIPFDEKAKISTLQEVQKLVGKFSFDAILSEKARTDVVTYDRESGLFKEFSEKARDIRNNNFEKRPELVADFDEFQKLLKVQIVRPLYPLQLLSAFHMAFSQNSCNFAVPGAGKTAIVYGAYTYLKSLPKDNPKHVDKLLVIGPLSSFAPWEKEYEACFGKKVHSQRLSGDYSIQRSEKREHLYATNPRELTLVSHGGVTILQSEVIAFLKRNRTMVIVDEAHRIKNPDGVWGRSAVEISKEAISRIVLTGTPVPNGYEDLYNLFQYLYPFKFKEIIKLHLPNLEDMTKNSDPDSDRVKEFTNNIAPYFIRIKKKDLHLPLTHDCPISVDMDPIQREIYDVIETKYVKAFQNNASANIRDFLNRAKLIRLRQAATNPGLLLKPLSEAFDIEDDQSIPANGHHLPDEYQDDSYLLARIRHFASNQTPRKFSEVKTLYETKILPTNGKVIVWSIFIQNAKELQRFLAQNNITARLLIGEVPQPEREKIVDDFNNPNNFDFRVVIANPFAVSESISLHKGCHNAIYIERDYNCATFLQSKDRIHRYGLLPDQLTDYYYLISTDSIDEVIDDRLTKKMKRMEKIVDDEIPLFSRINDSDETDLIKGLLIDYAKRA